MKKLLLFVGLLIAFAPSYAQINMPAGLTGRWTFDDASNPLHATVGNDLVVTGFQMPIAGPTSGDNAIRIAQGSYLQCLHNIPINGNGAPTMVNKYSIMIDFRIKQFGMWRCFYQADPSNTSGNDGEVFINPTGKIGVGASGYSSYSVMADQWYRLVITANLGNHFDYYLDGHLLVSGGAQTLDGRFALSPSSGIGKVLLFADDDGEDYIIDVAQVAIFDNDLTAVQIDSLGGFGHDITTHQTGINTYLQTPTPTSMYINWHSTQTASTSIQYGTTPALGLTATGTYESISTKQWHTVKLSGLTPDTHYYYKVISGTDTSQVYEFRTPFAQGTPGKHLRFLIMGDSQSDINMPAVVSNATEEKLKEIYGINWLDSISLFMRIGDLTGDGTVADNFEKEYFNPFGNIMHSIPSMSAIGNHEGESNNYYQYMKYEDVSDYAYPDTRCERYYNFSLGDCQFIALNTNGTYNNTLQATWLQNKLDQSNADAANDFVFVFNHQPGRSEVWPDGNNSYVQNTIQVALKNYPKVMLESYGHSHNYERGVLKSTHGQPQDTRVLCVGGAGAVLDRWGMYANQTDYPEIHRAIDHYSYVIVDVDIDQKIYTAKMFSLGHPDKRLNNIEMDSWYFSVNQPKPETPLAVNPSSQGSLIPILTASSFVGADSLMTSQFQLTAIAGDYSSPLIDITRDWEDLYGDSGAPNYSPINLNIGIDLKRLAVSAGVLTDGQTYGWRVRYRDFNIKWSDWSTETTFTATSSLSDSADFVADITTGVAPCTVHFTDLSTNTPTAWSWDFDGDGISDSQLQNPVWVYTTGGLYTVSLISYYGSDSSQNTKLNYINVDNTPGIVELKDNSTSIAVYPNPAQNYMIVRLASKENHGYSIEMYNYLNQKIKSQYLHRGENIISLKNIPSGLYMYRVLSESKVLKADKMVIQK